MNSLPNARDWQLALGQPGAIVTDLDDIGQCIRVILTTPKGSDPLRPEFGADAGQYIDYPIDQAAPHLVRVCWDAIELWEPRVELISIRPRLGDAPGHLILQINWRRRGAGTGAAEQATEVGL